MFGTFQDMAAKIESLENLLMTGKLSPDKYEAARAALEQQGEEQQKMRQLQNDRASEGAERDTKAALQRLRAVKIEAEAAVLKLSEQLRRGELSPEEFQVQKVKIRANLESETKKLGRSLQSIRTVINAEAGDESDAAARNAETLRKAGEARRAAAEAAQAQYAEKIRNEVRCQAVSISFP